MGINKFNTFALLVFSLFFLISAGAVKANSRVALVVGNGAYSNLPPLYNPLNDAADIATALRGWGFDVTLLTNQGHRQMLEEVAQFETKLRQGKTGLFYYAGHGVQVDGVNYLIPVDAQIQRDYLIPSEAVSVNAVLGAMESAANELNIVILDACRNNPFPQSSRAATRGLARVDAPRGSIIAYATAPGDVAADGDGRNGIYTKHLLSAINAPGLKVEEVFKQVRIGVAKESKGKQIPWEESSLTGDFYFDTGSSVGKTPSALVGSDKDIEKSADLAYWNAVKDSNNKKLFSAYLRNYPEGLFVDLARFNLQKMEGQHKPEPVPNLDLASTLLTCREHFVSNRLTTGEYGNAADCYHTVLLKYPDNTEALLGMAAIEDRYVEWAEMAISADRLNKAEGYLERLSNLDPYNSEYIRLEKKLRSRKADLESSGTGSSGMVSDDITNKLMNKRRKSSINGHYIR